MDLDRAKLGSDQIAGGGPHLITGVKLSVAYSVIGIVAGEFILATAGMGKRIAFGYQDFDNRTMYGMLLLLLVLVTVDQWRAGEVGEAAASPLRPAMSDRFDRYLLFVALLIVWQVVSMVVGPDVIPSPIQTISRAFVLVQSENFWKDAANTGKAFGLACAIAIVGGVGSIGVGFSRFATEVADPIVGTIYSIPKITLYPIILLVFGLTLSAKVAFGVIHGIFPIHLHHERRCECAR